jgi:pimeloyl-ACP methyl ester carboxylesterase
MPNLQVSPRVDIHYRVDDFTDPWRKPETILLCHGNNESHLAWYGWVPQLARRYRVVRPDMRGFGDSTPMARDFPWTLDVVIDDYLKLMDHLGIERFSSGGRENRWRDRAGICGAARRSSAHADRSRFAATGACRRGHASGAREGS